MLGDFPVNDKEQFLVLDWTENRVNTSRSHRGRHYIIDIQGHGSTSVSNDAI